MIDLGKVMPGSTVRIPFGSYAASTGASSATTNYVAGDVQIYKDGGTTQRASSSGITATADFDSLVGINLVSIDLADNTTAGFYAAGSEYVVVISDITIDSQTVRFPIGRFVIGVDRAVLNTTIATLASQTSFTLTAGPAEDSALLGCTAYLHDVASAVQGSFVYISAYTGSTKTVTLSSGPTYTAAATDNICIFAPTHVYGVSGTGQTARDLGASVLLSSGTGTGQISLSSGAVLLQATQTGVTIPTVTTVNGLASGVITAASIATDAIDADALATDAVTELNTAVLAAVSGIGTAGGAAINQDAATDNVLGGISGVTSGTTFLGTQSVGTYANTSNVNSVYHTITGTASGNTVMDIVYQYLTGSGTNVVQATWVGYVTSTNDTISISAWRHDTGAWELLTTIVGTAGTTIQTKNITLFSRHRGTSVAELGKVYLRLHCTGMTTPVVATDQFIVSYAISSRGTYSDGAVWLNTTASNTNTQSYVDGLPENPVSTIAAALTIAGNLNLKRIRVTNGSSVTFGASMAAYSLIGKNWTCALGGQAIDGAYIEGASVSGTGTCTTAAEFVDCHIAAGTTTGAAQFFRCGFSGTSGSKVTAGSAGEFLLVDCFSEVAGSGTPFFSFPGACGVNIRRWSGGSNITLNNTSATLTMEVVTGGGQTIELGGADVEIRGICRAVSLTGITSDSTAQINCVTGPISLAGADGTVNIYGVCGVVTDTRTGTPLGTNSALSLVSVNAEVDSALNTAIPGSPTADSINERIVALDTGVNITKVNNITIDGAGTALDPWGPV